MRRRAFLGSGGVAGGALLTGCLDGLAGSDDDPDGNPDDEGGLGREGAHVPEIVETTEVRLVDSAFEPRNVAVELGVPVTWENEDAYVHTVTAVGGSLDAEVEAGESVQHAFVESRVYGIYCRHHGDRSLAGMAMKIAVGNAEIEEPLGTGREGEY